MTGPAVRVVDHQEREDEDGQSGQKVQLLEATEDADKLRTISEAS